MQNQRLAARPQAGYQESVQLVTKVQYPCGCDTIFAIWENVKILGKINVDAGSS
jgi:hypothetical protein